MPSRSFYPKLRKLTARYLREAMPALRAWVRKAGSPLRALCLEYGDQVDFNIRVQSLADWRKDDEVRKTYVVKIKGKSVDLSRDQLLRRIRAGRLKADDLCRRAGSYREFRLPRLMPEAFGLSDAPARDLHHEYYVGNFDIVATVPDYLFDMLEEYWTEFLDGLDDERDEEFSGKVYGEKGESWSYYRMHRDAAFVRAVKGATRDVSREIMAIDHTDDFIAFLKLVESYFEPSLVAFGNRKQLNTR